VSAQQGVDSARIADALIERLQLQPGERVLLVAVPRRSDAIVAALRSRFKAARAVDLGVFA
jgi:hypothetical protein